VALHTLHATIFVACYAVLSHVICAFVSFNLCMPSGQDHPNGTGRHQA